MDQLSTTFSALADPTRRAILARLAEGEAHVGQLAAPFSISAPAISRHLRVLEDAGLIARRVDAQWRVCTLQAEPLRAALGWLEAYRRFWDEGLARLSALLESEEEGSGRRRSRDKARSVRRTSAAARERRTPKRRQR